MKKLLLLFGLVSVLIVLTYFAVLNSNNDKRTNDTLSPTPRTTEQEQKSPESADDAKREECHKKYDKFFQNTEEKNDPLSYDKTNPNLYSCLKELKDPLDIH